MLLPWQRDVTTSLYCIQTFPGTRAYPSPLHYRDLESRQTTNVDLPHLFYCSLLVTISTQIEVSTESDLYKTDVLTIP